MASEKLIPILDTVKNLRERRCVDGFKTLNWSRYYFNEPQFDSSKVMVWIEAYTTGRFHLLPRRVAFEDERDFIMFKLSYKDEN